MHKYIESFLRFLAPILRRAVVQVAADELARLAYPERRPVTKLKSVPYANGYRRVGKPGVVPFDVNVEPARYFHDVVLVAFDITGRDRKMVEDFLTPYFPSPDATEMLEDAGIGLDSWWFADDSRVENTDTDSAVFVKKGKQAEARRILHEYGLVD